MAWSPWERRLCFALPFVMRLGLTFLRVTGFGGGDPSALASVFLQVSTYILITRAWGGKKKIFICFDGFAGFCFACGWSHRCNSHSGKMVSRPFWPLLQLPQHNARFGGFGSVLYASSNDRRPYMDGFGRMRSNPGGSLHGSPMIIIKSYRTGRRVRRKISIWKS